ncbi:phospholipase [Naegleria gruberi]|uniref:Phospholipase n=1 Tax=Naegleria gruberi TaxID=5762 RepID=D2VR20_NAEGR|nr:phospholipase [Naegleria gruberi]EFC40732.1 phospholipase [Naegleria gruberi]|eukprot:XP_002673476.1 phospholipase [Naegleria gruberi]
MISELMNKQFLVIDETDIANIKINNDKSKGSSSPNTHSRSTSGGLAILAPNSPPSLTPLSTSPSHGNGSPSRFSGHRRGSSLSKGQLEIRKVYEKISNSPIFNVKDKVLEKNQKAIQLSNDESLLALYFNDWLEVMEEQCDSHHCNQHGKSIMVKKKDHFHVKFTMYDMDDYPFYFPLNLLDDGRLHDDFVKFSVTFFIPSIKEREKTFLFLEDGLVHKVERSDFKLSSEGALNYKSASIVIREHSDKCKILKKLKKICKVIQEFNIDKTFHMNNKGGSFFFCRKIAKIFSEEGNLKSSLSDNIKKLFKLWKESADKKKEDEEHLDDFYHDPFYSKNEHVPMDDLSNLVKKATQTIPEKVKSNAIHPSAYEIINEKIMTTSSMMANGKDTFPLFEFHLPKKGHFHFESYSQFNEFLYEHFQNEEGLEKLKKQHPMDYLYLKILDRKLWCCKIATGLFDPLISKPYLFNIGSRKPFFSIPISLKEYFGNAESVQIDYTKLKESKQGKTVKVLCLDGGGMRGLCIIEQLIAMEQKTGKKINELFDLVCGTSTGGIISFFIEAGYSMEEVKAKYMLMGRDIFNIKSKFSNMKKAFNFLRGKSWYETKIIEKYFKEETGRMDLYSATNTRPFVFVCGTIKPEKVKEPGSVVSSKFVEQFPYIFRTYPNPFLSTKELSDKILDPYLDFLPKNEYDDIFYSGTTTGRGVKIVESLRATTAAPIFFDPTIIGNDHFTDGGIVANNPSAIALNEVMRMYMGHSSFIFVSLGTGKKRRKVFDSESIDMSSTASSKKGSSFSSTSSADNISERSFVENLIITASDLKLLIDLVISSERIHAQMLTTVKLLNERDVNANISYYRFDPEDLGQYDLDCILPEVIEKYEKTTREYILSQPDFDVVCKRLLDP